MSNIKYKKRQKKVNAHYLYNGPLPWQRTPENEDNRAKIVHETHTIILKYDTYFCPGGALNFQNSGFCRSPI